MRMCDDNEVRVSERRLTDVTSPISDMCVCSNDVNQVRVSSERRLADVLYLRLMCAVCDDLSLAVSERSSDVES